MNVLRFLHEVAYEYEIELPKGFDRIGEMHDQIMMAGSIDELLDVMDDFGVSSGKLKRAYPEPAEERFQIL